MKPEGENKITFCDKIASLRCSVGCLISFVGQHFFVAMQ
jgi:hypothetical protein